MSRALDEVPQAETEAAATLGASPFRIFQTVVIPRVAPAVASVFAQVFSLCAMSFVLVMILGGGPPVETLETTLFSKIRAGGLDLSGASVCAAWQIMITMLPWIVLRRLGALRLDPGRASRKRGAASRRGIWIGSAVALIFFLPYFALLHDLNLPRLWHDGNGLEVVQAMKTSLGLAALASCLSVLVALLGVWAETRSRLFAQIGSLALVVPSGISIMVLGLGFFIAYEKIIDPFSSSIWPIALLQAVFFVPVAFRVFQPIGRSRDHGAWEAAATLGGSPIQTFQFVEWPRWRGPVVSVITLIAGAALGEVAAVSLFYNENRIPVSLLITRWMGRYQVEEAQALSLILLVASGVLVSLGFIRSSEREYARVD